MLYYMLMPIDILCRRIKMPLIYVPSNFFCYIDSYCVEFSHICRPSDYLIHFLVIIDVLHYNIFFE